MPTLNNYNYSSVSYQITEGDNVPSEIGAAVITLEPVAGFSLDANDFSLGGAFSDPNVDSVVFTQDGDNVLVTVTFVPGFVMPSDNYNVGLCIDGAGVAIPITISGFINANISANINNDSSETNTPYSASGSTGETVLLFSRLYTAASGYFLSEETILINGEQSPDNYTIVETPLYDVDNNLSSIRYDIYYTFPNASYSNHNVQIIVSATEIPVVNAEVTRWKILNTVIPFNGDTRPVKVYGGAGAEFSISIDDGSGPVNIITNAVIPSSGLYEDLVTFGPVLVDTTYTLTISGDIAVSVNANIILNQYIQTTIEFDPDGTGFNLPSNAVISGMPLTHYSNSTPKNTIEFTWNITSSTPPNVLSLDRQPEIQDISNFEEVYAVIDGSVSNSTTFDVVDASNLLAKMEFNQNGIKFAPFDAEIDTIVGNTITVNNPVTLNDGDEIAFTLNSGNYINVEEFSASLDSNEITINAKIYFTDFGREGTTFLVNLDNFISQAAPSVFNMTASNIDSATACSDSSYVNNVYVSDNTFDVGKIVYTDSGLTTAFVGDNGWYRVENFEGLPNGASISIDPSGEIIGTIAICSI